jgi:hypothetical protein
LWFRGCPRFESDVIDRQSHRDAIRASNAAEETGLADPLLVEASLDVLDLVLEFGQTTAQIDGLVFQ